MSRPRHRWYWNVIRAIRYYPELASAEQISPRELEELDAVRTAIENIGRQKDGDEALRVVEMVDWRKTHTIEGAAYKLNMSEKTARNRRSRFIREVARNMRYVR